MNTFFKALNDATRREILDMLREHDLSAGEIAEAFNISRPSISHHLEILKQAGLVDTERKGQFIYYSLNTTGLEDVTQWLFKLMNEN
jgi:DNA-binding transcriptional ArsR family regulator